MVINGVNVEVNHKHPNKHIQSKVGNLLILGGGRCVWGDYEKARIFFDLTGYNNGSYEIMCVNDIATQFKAEPIHHAVSLHKGILSAVMPMRKEKAMFERVLRHSNADASNVDVNWAISNVGGTSGLFAVKIALVMGYMKIILCGIPMDCSGHYFDPVDSELNQAAQFKDKSVLSPWRDAAQVDEFRERVRSMSGRTAGFLGEPTQEWARS